MRSHFNKYLQKKRKSFYRLVFFESKSYATRQTQQIKLVFEFGFDDTAGNPRKKSR